MTYNQPHIWSEYVLKANSEPSIKIIMAVHAVTIKCYAMEGYFTCSFFMAGREEEEGRLEREGIRQAGTK